MSGLKSKKGQDLQKPVQGCMGRMINVFDLSTGMGGTKLLTDKAYRDGLPSYKNRPDVVKRTTNPAAISAEEKRVTSEESKNTARKSRGTPMKTLIAQEMSKEMESKKRQPNVVARLMGLDDELPAHQSILSTEGSFGRSSHASHVSLAGALQSSRQHEDSHFVRSTLCEVHSRAREKDYRDLYEVYRTKPKGRLYDDSHTERRMALVRKKFIEAKRLATDEKLLHSKDFQDALEVLSSNRDLFLKFLEEPNSILAKHLQELHSIPTAPQKTRITVLKPSRTAEKKQSPESNEGGREVNKQQRISSLTQPTRIVILKPSHAKRHDMKLMENDDISRDEESMQCVELRQTQHMRESFSSNRRDESLLSSVLSNGYVGDESSFNRSENGYAEGEDGSFSDLDIATPTSPHSWEYSNRFDSPYSCSSFSRTSDSSEPSVLREAKKRLSERWALVSSHGNGRERAEVRRSSSTLGEMLSLYDIKKEEGDLTHDLSSSETRDENCAERSPCNLLRSKSVPISSSAYENIELYSETLDSQVKRTTGPAESAKSKSGRSSFKGKVSSLFFSSRNKKGAKEKSASSPVASTDDRFKFDKTEPIHEKNDGSLSPVNKTKREGSSEVDCKEGSVMVASPASGNDGSVQRTISFRDALALEKPIVSESLSGSHSDPSSTGKNQDQPSPTSILDAPFNDETNNSTPRSSEVPDAGRSSALVESVTRLFSWDDVHLEPSPDASNTHKNPPNANLDDEQHSLFVRKLLSSVGLENENVSKMFSKWHAVHCPLDTILLDKFLERKEEDAKIRERRANQRLLFDCVNAALLEIGKTVYLNAYPWPRTHATQKRAAADARVGDEVWLLVKERFFGEEKLESSETDSGSLMVDRLLRYEICGNKWDEFIQSEIDNIASDISEQLFEELVSEAFSDLTVECL